MLMTEHNLWFYQRLMQDLRDAIAERRLDGVCARRFRGRYRGESLESRRLLVSRRSHVGPTDELRSLASCEWRSSCEVAVKRRSALVAGSRVAAADVAGRAC